MTTTETKFIRYELEDGTIGKTNAPHFPGVGGEWWTVTPGTSGQLKTEKSPVVWTDEARTRPERDGDELANMIVAGCDVSVREQPDGTVCVYVLTPADDNEIMHRFARFGDALRGLAEMADMHDGGDYASGLATTVFTEYPELISSE